MYCYIKPNIKKQWKPFGFVRVIKVIENKFHSYIYIFNKMILLLEPYLLLLFLL